MKTIEESYGLDDILTLWGDDESHREDYKEKGYSTWKEWRIDKMNNHGVTIDRWYKKDISINDVGNFRVGAFPSIRKIFEVYLQGDTSNYLKIDETKVVLYEKLYNRNENKINSIIKNIPKEINFIAWERNNEYILTEGHHRAISLMRALRCGINIDGIRLNLYYHPVKGSKLVKNIDYL